MSERQSQLEEANVWKIGSRWGNLGKSILDLFIQYQCVFFNADGEGNVGDWPDVQSGDLFVISEGTRPVAVARATSPFQRADDVGLSFTRQERKEFIDGLDVVACRAEVSALTGSEQEEYYKEWHLDPRRRFCRCRNDETLTSVRRYWEKTEERLKKRTFEINSQVWGLFGEERSLFSPHNRFRIPIYQRPYSWGENEVRRLLEDLSLAVQNKEPVFMGTMQLSYGIPLDSRGERYLYDLIDGQQRVTTFILLLSILEKRLREKCGVVLPDYLRTSVNRGEEQTCWDAYRGGCSDVPGNPYTENSQMIERLLAEYFDGDENNPSLQDLYTFLLAQGNLSFVVIQTKAGLSKILKIFHTINTTGLDLGVEDIFKIRLYEYRRWCGDSEEVFDRISEIYARIERSRKEHPDRQPWLSMSELLWVYQKALVAKWDLAAPTFYMGVERFYEELFDTLMGTRVWDGFGKCEDAKKDILQIDDLERLLDILLEKDDAEKTNPEYRIWTRMIRLTRYPDVAVYDILARFFEQIDDGQMCEFSWKLFRLLVPSSLFYGKTIYAMHGELLNLLRNISKLEDGGAIALLDKALDSNAFAGQSLDLQIQAACDYQIAWTPKWKNLLCRLVEVIVAGKRDDALYDHLFYDWVEIEHIQPATDEDDRQRTWEEWGEELNKIGNLVLLEGTLNRSIQNHAHEKPEAYAKSCFESAQMLKDKVGRWRKEDALQRKGEITEMVCRFVLGRE